MLIIRARSMMYRRKMTRQVENNKLKYGVIAMRKAIFYSWKKILKNKYLLYLTRDQRIIKLTYTIRK